MKKLALICLLLASPQARGDLVIVETIENGGHDESEVMKIKGGKISNDVGARISTISDVDTGDVILIFHPRKQYIKLAAVKAAELMKKMRGPNAAPTPGPAAKITDTGRQEKVHGYNAEIYVTEPPASKFTYWISKDVPHYEEINALIKKLQASIAQIGVAPGQAVPDTSRLPGFYVKMEDNVNGEVQTVTLVSVKEQAVDDSEFQPPPGYTEVAPRVPAKALPAALKP